VSTLGQAITPVEQVNRRKCGICEKNFLGKGVGDNYEEIKLSIYTWGLIHKALRGLIFLL
jgi:hypothetical protein